jgi:hypothetical protein
LASATATMFLAVERALSDPISACLSIVTCTPRLRYARAAPSHPSSASGCLFGCQMPASSTNCQAACVRARACLACPSQGGMQC